MLGVPLRMGLLALHFGDPGTSLGTILGQAGWLLPRFPRFFMLWRALKSVDMPVNGSVFTRAVREGLHERVSQGPVWRVCRGRCRPDARESSGPGRSSSDVSGWNCTGAKCIARCMSTPAHVRSARSAWFSPCRPPRVVHTHTKRQAVHNPEHWAACGNLSQVTHKNVMSPTHGTVKGRSRDTNKPPKETCHRNTAYGPTVGTRVL